MKKVKFFLIVLIFNALSIVYGQTPATQKLINEYVKTLPPNAEVAIGVIINGEISTQGYQKENGAIKSVQNELNIFEIGSITKTFTATLLMQKNMKGEMNLDDPIHHYFQPSDKINNPEFNKVTFRQILTHTSGLASEPGTIVFPVLSSMITSRRNPYKKIAWKHYRKYLREKELDYMPGQNWVYNNCAFGLLGTLVAQSENTNWETMIQEQIFDKLGMSYSYPTGQNVPRQYFVQGYDRKAKPAPYWDMDFFNPAGSIKSCVKDQLIWLNAHLTAEKNSVFHQMKTHYDIPADWKGSVMGNAWAHRITDQQHIIWHGGATGTFRAFCSYDDEAKTAVVILVNYSNSHPAMKKDGKSLIRTYGFQIQESLSETQVE